MRKVPPRTQTQRSALVTAASALATTAVLALPQSAGAAETAPIGYGAGTTGGGGATPVTVSALAAFRSAVTGNAAKVVRVSGLISLSGQVDIGEQRLPQHGSRGRHEPQQ